jgi:hypothetical protein
MLDLVKVLQRLAADASGRRVGIGVLGVLVFEILEFVEKLVVGGVGDFGSGLRIIETVVVMKLLAKIGNFFGGGHGSLAVFFDRR